MAATTWYPMAPLGRRWMLADGTILAEPEIEETSTRRKIRIAGANASVYQSDLDDLIWTNVESRAMHYGSRPVLPMHRDHSVDHTKPAPDELTDGPVTPHFVGGKWRGVTTLWWRFKHKTMPIEIKITLVITGHGRDNDSSQKIQCWVELPLLHADTGRLGFWATGHSESEASNRLLSSLGGDSWDSFNDMLEHDPLDWGLDEVLCFQKPFINIRETVRDLIRRIRILDEIASLDIPVADDPSQPYRLKLDVIETNVSNELVDTMRDMLDAEPQIARAHKAYSELQRAMRELGMVMEERDENQLLAAFQAGSDALTVNCGSPAGETGPDHVHKITMRLMTGTFIVECSVRAQGADGAEVAAAWQEALALASITGQEPLLLGFARAYAEQAEGKRTKRILDRHA